MQTKFFNKDEPIFIRMKPRSKHQPHGNFSLGQLRRKYVAGEWTEEPPSDGRNHLVLYLLAQLPHGGMYPNDPDLQEPIFEAVNKETYERILQAERVSQERQRYERIMGHRVSSLPSAPSSPKPPPLDALIPKTDKPVVSGMFDAPLGGSEPSQEPLLGIFEEGEE